jgi:transposase
MSRDVSKLAAQAWPQVEPLLPKHQPSRLGGRPRCDDRQCFEGIIWVLVNGSRWIDLPKIYPSYATCWRRHREWTGEGVWNRAWQAVLRKLRRRHRLGCQELYLDAFFVAAKKGDTTSAKPSVARA